MAVYLLTFHAYRSWRPDNPRGYVRKNEGIQPPDPQMAEWYDRDAKHTPAEFDGVMQRVMVDAIAPLCEKQDWRAHYIYAGSTHVHMLLSWKQFAEWNDVRVSIKRDFGRVLSKLMDRSGPWFSRGGKDSHKRVTERSHFDYLMNAYLPKRKHHGTHWRADRGVWEQ
ncbi:MAG: hypothetical protein ACYC26_09420 [Phycisphaerales bacterium]